MKKTKAEEKDDLILATKTSVIDKYGGARQKTKKAGMTANMTGSGVGFEDKSGF